MRENTFLKYYRIGKLVGRCTPVLTNFWYGFLFYTT